MHRNKKKEGRFLSSAVRGQDFVCYEISKMKANIYYYEMRLKINLTKAHKHIQSNVILGPHIHKQPNNI